MVVNPKTIPVKNIQEFTAYVKAHPGKINYASIGNGSSQHLAAVQFELATGTKMTHVPYAGAPPILADLLSGAVPVTFQNIPTVQGLLGTGQLKALAVTTRQRSKLLPDVPTLQEEGLKGFESYAWFGLLAPKGTPPAIVERLNKEVLASMADPALHQRMLKIGAEPNPTSSAEFKALISSEVAKWRKIIQNVAGAEHAYREEGFISRSGRPTELGQSRVVWHLLRRVVFARSRTLPHAPKNACTGFDRG